MIARGSAIICDYIVITKTLRLHASTITPTQKKWCSIIIYNINKTVVAHIFLHSFFNIRQKWKSAIRLGNAKKLITTFCAKVHLFFNIWLKPSIKMKKVPFVWGMWKNESHTFALSCIYFLIFGWKLRWKWKKCHSFGECEKMSHIHLR